MFRVVNEFIHILSTTVVYLEKKKGLGGKQMFTDSVDHRSGLSNVWVYFPRTLIPEAATYAGLSQHNLGDGNQRCWPMRYENEQQPLSGRRLSKSIVRQQANGKATDMYANAFR